jgi:hypothetical protein
VNKAQLEVLKSFYRATQNILQLDDDIDVIAGFSGLSGGGP